MSKSSLKSLIRANQKENSVDIARVEKLINQKVSEDKFKKSNH